MTYDFYAEFCEENKKKLERKLANIKKKGKPKQVDEARKRLPEYFQNNFSPNWYSKLKEISLFTKFYEGKDQKELLKAGYNGFILDNLTEGDVYKMDREWVLREREEFKSSIFEDIAEPEYEPNNLPNSAFIHVKFTLKKPYLSRDDEEFYLHENPVTKEHIFKIPYIKASSWKGNLRWVMRKKEVTEDTITRIFGNEKGSDLLKKGRLRTYPTFFNSIDLDVINPHDRETKVGIRPITLEAVPEKTKGDLYLLYFPFDKIGENKEVVKREVKSDLNVLCDSIRELLETYGISAKRSSGYGAAKIDSAQIDSKLLIESEKEELLSLVSGGETKS